MKSCQVGSDRASPATIGFRAREREIGRGGPDRIEGRQERPRYARDSALVALGPEGRKRLAVDATPLRLGKRRILRMSAASSRLAPGSRLQALNATYAPSQPHVAVIVAPIDSAARAICSRDARRVPSSSIAAVS